MDVYKHMTCASACIGFHWIAWDGDLCHPMRVMLISTEIAHGGISIADAPRPMESAQRERRALRNAMTRYLHLCSTYDGLCTDLSCTDLDQF